MRIDITAQQYTSFQNNKEITFGKFFSDDELTIARSCNAKRNNFRTNPLVKKLLLRKDIGLIIHELTKSPQVRLLEDQIVQNTTLSLPNLAFQGILIGVLIDLETKEVVFFHPEKEIVVENKSLVAIYGQGNALYVQNDQDPSGHELKKLGYCFGSRLKPSDFPFIYH